MYGACLVRFRLVEGSSRGDKRLHQKTINMKQINRRSFLHQSALAVAAMGSVPRVLQAASSPNGFQFGLVTYQWGKDLDLPSLIATCEKAGIHGVELRTQHAHQVEPVLSAAERSEVKKRFADSSVTLVGYGSNAEFHSTDPAKVKENIELAKQYIQLMKDCGGSGVKIKPNAFVDNVPHEKTIEQIGKSINKVAAFGAELGQEVRVEVHGKGTSEIPAIKSIFEVADHPNAKICWNSNPGDLNGQGLEHNFELLHKRFGHTTHVRQLDTPDYPFAKLLKSFQGIQYQGWILLEAGSNPPENLVESLEAQRNLFEQMTS